MPYPEFDTPSGGLTGADDRDAARLRRRAARGAEVNTAVAAAVRAGEHSCSWDAGCPTWRVRGLVWRCAACGGLEPGQVFTAEDVGLITEDQA